MALRVFAENEKNIIKIESYKGAGLDLKVVESKEFSLPKDTTITKIIAPYFYPTRNCPDEGTVYLFDDINKKWGITKVSLENNIKVEPLRWFPF